jgi:hypothetical protein
VGATAVPSEANDNAGQPGGELPAEFGNGFGPLRSRLRDVVVEQLRSQPSSVPQRGLFAFHQGSPHALKENVVIWQDY